MGDEALVYVPAAETAYTLNRSALAIFDLCDGRRTLGDICRECAQMVGSASEELLPDVKHGMSELGRMGLVAFD
jgi:hypothetical protein